MPGPYYVGQGGNDGNSGLSWAQRKLTLNGAEDIPVAAGDTVYVGPGVYRERLAIDIDGVAGSPISYIGDVTGRLTDGIGGVVRITASDDDIVSARASCVFTGVLDPPRSYRTFRGFRFDMSSTAGIYLGVGDNTNWTLQDCSFFDYTELGGVGFYVTNTGPSNHLIERCYFEGQLLGNTAGGVYLRGVVDLCNDIIRNCVFLSSGIVTEHGAGTIRNCSFFQAGVRSRETNAAFTPTTVKNCVISYASTALTAVVGAQLVENYNNLYADYTLRGGGVGVGANSLAYPPLYEEPMMSPGFASKRNSQHLSKWSLLKAITDDGAAPADDFYGITRPVTNGKRSWGAIQYQNVGRDAITTHGASTASVKISDTGRHQVWVPHGGAVPHTISCYVYREANYAGTNPSMIIKQPGQADTVITDAGAAGAWNLLTTTITPSALPCYVVVELVSENTAIAGNYAAYFDDLDVA